MLIKSTFDRRLFAPETGAGAAAPGGASAGAGAAAAGGADAAAAAAAAAATAGAGAGAGAAAAGAIPDWRAPFPEDIRNSPYLKDHDTPEKTARELINLQGLIGKKGAIVPAETDPPEKWDEFYKAAGRPEKADAYEFKMPAGVEATEADKQFHGKVGTLFHKAGLNPRQAAIINEGWNEITASFAGDSAKAIETNQASAKQVLEQAWGPKANEEMALADRVVAHFGGPELVKELALGTRPGDNPRLAIALAKVGRALAGDLDFVNSAGGGASGAGGAAAELDAIYAAAGKDPKHPYSDPSHPEHKAMKDKVMALSAAAATAKK